MAKTESAIITFRIKPDQLALALTALIEQNPLGDYDKLSKIGKAVFMVGLQELIKNDIPVSQQAVDKLNKLTTKTDFKMENS